MLNNISIPSDVKSYYEFCTFFSLHQLIQVPTRITCNSATIIDHILASYPERVTQQGIIDVGLSDHQLIFAQENFLGLKEARTNIKFRSFKHYSADLSKETLTSINFRNYLNFNDTTEAYGDFIQKIMVTTDKVAPTKERRIKHNSQEWFDGEISEAIKNRDKLLKKFKKSRLHIDKELYNAARYKVHKLIFNKKKDYFENKLSECICKPKELWKALKSLGLPNKTSSCEVSALKVNKTVQYDTNLVLGGFKHYYSNLAGNLLKKLPKPPNKFTLNSVFQHYKGIIQSDSFNLATVSENTILTILKNTKVSKATGLDNLSGRFLRDGAKVLTKPITDICNLSITSGKFPDSCKLAKLKPIYKKGSLTEASNYRPISLLPLISKVIEKVIHDQTSAFLNSRNLLYNYQSGFRKKHSTDFCFSFLNDKILKAFDQGLVTGMILIDLQKAFDTIDHDILLQKLYATSFSKHSVNWFRSYLTNRTFLVNLGMCSLNLHVCPVVYRKDLFWVLYSFLYILMICHKL